MNDLSVINLSGEKEPFSYYKVLRSARRAGASKRVSEMIAEEVKRKARSGMRTSEIYSMVRFLLNKEEPKTAIKFDLKEAMKRLGPTGFPFEKFIGNVLAHEGYSVRLNQFVPGKCCPEYEIDFLASKQDVLYVGECKYKSLFEGRVDLPDALQNHARFLDIKEGRFFEKEKKILKSSLVTNAKFSSLATKYSECAGVGLLGWKYPKGDGLERHIESSLLYPVTILPSLKRYLADIFIEKGILLAKDLLDEKKLNLLGKSLVSSPSFKSLVKEAEILLK